MTKLVLCHYLHTHQVFHLLTLYFSQGCSSYFFLIFAHLWWFGGWDIGLRSWTEFFGVGFSVDVVWGQWYGAFWFFRGWGSLYKHRRITLAKELCFTDSSYLPLVTHLEGLQNQDYPRCSLHSESMTVNHSLYS